MDLSKLKDEELDSSNIAIAKTEREVLSKVLHHLRETERRRLFSKYKFSSIVDYAIYRMGYTQDQAWRRINAMRLLKELPQIEEKIDSGALNLTQMNQARMLFSREIKAQVYRTKEEKLELLKKVERQPRAQVEKTLERESLLQPVIPNAFGSNLLKPVEIDQFRPEMQKKLKRLIEIRSHKHFNGVSVVLEDSVDLALKRWDPLTKSKGIAPARIVSRPKFGQDNAAIEPLKGNSPNASSPSIATRQISFRLRNEVFQAGKGQCENCGSRSYLEIDHIVPFATGGKTELSNLRLLCRSCNQRHAIKTYGIKKMEAFLK
jgi:hypothetical protein